MIEWIENFIKILKMSLAPDEERLSPMGADKRWRAEGQLMALNRVLNKFVQFEQGGKGQLLWSLCWNAGNGMHCRAVIEDREYDPEYPHVPISGELAYDARLKILSIGDFVLHDAEILDIHKCVMTATGKNNEKPINCRIEFGLI